MRGSKGPALPAFVFGSIVLLFATTSISEAATVRSLRSRSGAHVTEIVVDCDGDTAVHGRSETLRDGALFVVELHDTTLAQGLTRILPVEDARVSGVVATADSASGSVRLVFDLAGRVDAGVRTLENPPRVVITLADPGTAEAAPGPAETPAPRAVASPPARPPSAPAPRQAATPAAASPRAAATNAQPASRSEVARRRLIVLDPGHGGKDPGARSWQGEWEKDIVLDIASRVAERLRRRLGVEVLMTRGDDQFVSLADRRAMAARWGGDLFVSIHANASANTAASGVETYFHSGPVDPAGPGEENSRASRRLLREENGGRMGARRSAPRPASVTGRTLPPLLQADSKRLAHAIQGELVRNLGMRYEAVRDLGVKEGPFFVLEDIEVPSVLVEAAFLTHREEGLRIRSSVYREQVAEGIFRGIERYLAGEAKSGAL